MITMWCLSLAFNLKRFCHKINGETVMLLVNMDCHEISRGILRINREYKNFYPISLCCLIRDHAAFRRACIT